MKKYILVDFSNVIYGEKNIIVHNKKTDKYFVFEKEASYVLLSFNGVFNVDRIVEDTTKYFNIPSGIAKTFVLYIINVLQINNLIMEIK